MFNNIGAPVRVKDLEAFGARLLTRLRIAREAGVGLIDDRKMRSLNRRHCGKDRTTDVLSFPYEPMPGEAPRHTYLGDVAISWPQARRNAESRKTEPQEELQGLLLHGILHLLGYDHEQDAGEMVELEGRLRAEFGLG